MRPLEALVLAQIANIANELRSIRVTVKVSRAGEGLQAAPQATALEFIDGCAQRAEAYLVDIEEVLAQIRGELPESHGARRRR